MYLDSMNLTPSFDLEPLRHFVRTEVMPGAADADRTSEFRLDIYKRLHALGWLQAAIPKELGGSGASTTDLLWIAREISYGSSGLFTSVLGNLLGLTAVVLFAPEPLREKICKNYITNFSLFSFCMTEPDAGTDVVNISTTAVKCERGYRISGKKCFITNASYSDHLVVFAKVQSSSSPQAKISAFYIPANTNGVSRGKELKKMGQRESNTAEIYFDDVFVPEEHLLAAEGEGLTILKRCIQRSKTLIAGAAVGVAQRATSLASSYLSQRIHYGAPLLNIPTVHSQMAQLSTELEASWMLACYAAARWDTGDMAIKEASMAKLYSSDMATRLVSESLELFGGYGFSSEFEIERLFRDVRGYEIFEGASLVQLTLIARELFPSIREKVTLRKVA
jgi:acyl-CoA dehydrogenase